MTFRKFWKISGRKRDVFLRNFNFQGGYPGFWRNLMKKWVLGGSFEAISGRKREDWPFLARKGSKWPKIIDFGGLGGPRTPSFRGPWGPYQTPPLRGFLTENDPIFPLNDIGFGVIFGPQRAINSCNCCHFWSKSLKSGFLRRKNGYFFFLLRSSFFLSLEKISCELTFVYIYKEWGALWGPLGTGWWGGFSGTFGLFLALFGPFLPCVQWAHEGLKRCDPFTVIRTKKKKHS